VTRWLSLVLVASMLIVGALGCGDPDATDDTNSGEERVSSVGATVTPDGSGSPGADGTTAEEAGGAAGEGLPEGADTTAILKELDAVRRELDAISLPDDADFADIEAALK